MSKHIWLQTCKLNWTGMCSFEDLHFSNCSNNRSTTASLLLTASLQVMSKSQDGEFSACCSGSCSLSGRVTCMSEAAAWPQTSCTRPIGTTYITGQENMVAAYTHAIHNTLRARTSNVRDYAYMHSIKQIAADNMQRKRSYMRHTTGLCSGNPQPLSIRFNKRAASNCDRFEYKAWKVQTKQTWWNQLKERQRD